MTMHALDCATLDERLADYLEGDLDFAARREVEAHVASCARCAALLRDLEHIRVSAAETCGAGSHAALTHPSCPSRARRLTSSRAAGVSTG